MTKPLIILLLITFCGCGEQYEEIKKLEKHWEEFEKLSREIDSLKKDIDKEFEILDSLERNMKIKLKND